MTARNHSQGFTLLELLVVIAIIGTLASIVISSIGSARDSAGYAKIAAEGAQIEKALEVYALETGAYPSFEYCDYRGAYGSCGGAFIMLSIGCGATNSPLESLLIPEYLSAGFNNGGGSCYRYLNGSDSYQSAGSAMDPDRHYVLLTTDMTAADFPGSDEPCFSENSTLGAPIVTFLNQNYCWARRR